MTKESNNLLVNFMHKNSSAKILKQNKAEKSRNSTNLIAEKKNKANDIADDKENIEELKKESMAKAQNYDQTELIKKLFLEHIVKYALLITLLVVFALGVIKLGPILSDFIHHFLFNLLIGNI